MPIIVFIVCVSAAVGLQMHSLSLFLSLSCTKTYPRVRVDLTENRDYFDDFAGKRDNRWSSYFLLIRNLTYTGRITG